MRAGVGVVCPPQIVRQKDKLPDKVRILKRDRGNLNIETCYVDGAAGK